VSPPRRSIPWDWSEAQDAALIRRYLAGETLEELSAEFGRSIGAIDKRVRVLRDEGVALPIRKPRWSAADKQRLVKRYKDGASRNELAAEFGKAKGTINRQLAALREAGVDLTRKRQAVNQYNPRRN
jgi:transposase